MSSRHLTERPAKRMGGRGVIDKWMAIKFPKIKMVRYADDMIVHCRSEDQAKELLGTITERFLSCGLKVHPKKTKIVYCKKDRRNLEGHQVQFDFLGFSFRPIMMQLRAGGNFLQYDCKMSGKSKKRILSDLRTLQLHRKTNSNLEDLALLLNPKIRGWINYYGKIKRKSLNPVFYYLHNRLLKMGDEEIQTLQREYSTSRKMAEKNDRRFPKSVLPLEFRLSTNLTN